MPIFRVHGRDRDNRLTSIDIDCASESIARNLAIERGLRNTLSVEIIEGDIDPAAVVRPAERIARRPIADPLRERPIRTIALGVFVGMLLWTALWLLLSLFLDLIGFALPRP
ncbi:MAG: hypothetical protein ACF8SC_01830 [Phycisphaerales bacterium JB037]